ncbi:DUF177 domain-containing protein [soil metagenome]
MSAQDWSLPVPLHEVARGAKSFTVDADEATRAGIARTLDLAALLSFEASVRVKPWLDGAELDGRWSARVRQVCGVSLDEFETPLSGEFHLHVVPAGSDLAPTDDDELTADPEAPDPPDVLEGDEIDVAAYLVEHLALELDPFPRKPGVVFEPPEEPGEPSPFAALARLKPLGDA